MAGRVVLISLYVAAVALISEAPAFACPNCRADATGLTPTAPASADDADPFPLRLSGGADFTSAFYFRGYEQADQGPIFQPYLNVFTVHAFDEDVVVKPYVSLFHSANWDSGNRMADMSDVMLGAVTTAHGFSLDARYAYYTMNPLMRSPVHELGAKASFDVLSLNDEIDWLQSCSLRPFIGLYGELNDGEGTEDGFLNVGIEPSWRFQVRGRKVGMSLPIDWGLSADHYYFNNDGSNAAFGYFSTALTTSVALPIAARHGQWFLNTSVQYLHLAADSVRDVSDQDDVCIGKIGVSFVY
ncbi:MAG TPA: hypothetical protein VM165_18415 [Planctomycetaceae bacterium]|nr:hypothetical protein [Planctomycetaceae bacterium]